MKQPNPSLSFLFALRSMRGTRAGKLLAVKPLYLKLLSAYVRRYGLRDFGDLKIRFNPNDLVTCESAIFGEYEKSEMRLVRKIVKPGSVVIDLGANIGLYSTLCARLAGKDGRVYAFEPDDVNYSFLLQNLKINGLDNVTPIKKAAYSSSGEKVLYINEWNLGDHRFYNYDSLSESTTVQTVRVDDCLSGERRVVDFIKMDIQGAEGDAVLGMRGILSKSPRLAMLMEFWPYGIKLAGHDPKGLLESLRDMGLHFFSIRGETGTLAPISIDGVLDAVDARDSETLDFRKEINLACFKNPKEAPESF